MFIENCARYQIKEGNHSNPGNNSMLIQIADYDNKEFPKPKHNFKVIKQYRFEDSDFVSKNHPYTITKEQADSIAEDLRYAYKHKMNVIVHCVMGVSRSGAVVEAGIRLGFKDTEQYRHPNFAIKSMILNSLGIINESKKYKKPKEFDYDSPFGYED